MLFNAQLQVAWEEEKLRTSQLYYVTLDSSALKRDEYSESKDGTNEDIH